MIDSVEQLQILYEISMSIGAKLDLKEMLKRSLSTMLKKLNCSAGAILFYPEGSSDLTRLEMGFSIPRNTEHHKGCAAARGWIDENAAAQRPILSQLPFSQTLEDGTTFTLFDLPSVGLLILVKNGTPLNHYMVQSLKPLMVKLATACESSLKGGAFERSRLTLETVLNTVGEGIITIDTDGRIVMVNQEVQQIWGLPEEALIGRSLQALMPQKYRDAHENGMARYIRTGRANVLGKRLELEGLRSDGTIFPLELRITESKLGDVVLFTAAVRDITERKALEQLRETFVATVSHELRTPLASIMGFLETVLGGRPGPLTDVQTRFLTNSYKNSERLLKLIEEILTVSQIQDKGLKLQRQIMLPSTLIEDTLEMLEHSAQAKGLSLSLEDSWPAGEAILADPDRIEQVMINLISNAIKFTPHGRSIEVRSEQTAAGWHFRVSDSGIGIAEEEIPKLFQRFYRANNAAEAQIQGTGIGLFICQAIVEGHGGVIGLESELGEGTTVWFTIPLSADHS